MLNLQGLTVTVKTSGLVRIEGERLAWNEVLLSQIETENSLALIGSTGWDGGATLQSKTPGGPPESSL